MQNRTITANVLEEYRIYLIESEKSNATIEKYIRDIKCLKNFLHGKYVTKTLMMEYKEYLKSKFAPSSVNSMIAAANSFFRYKGWQDCCVRQIKVQTRAFCQEENELSKEEYLRLLKAAKSFGNNRLEMIVQTICSTGIRVSELKFITVEAVQSGEAIVDCKGKTRTVFIVNKLRRKLLKYASEAGIKSGPIFLGRTGKPVNRCTVWREMKQLCGRAAVSPSKVFPHNLRHLFARIFYSMEKDIAKLADILGHTSINTTRVYIISSGAEHRRKMEKMKLIL